MNVILGLLLIASGAFLFLRSQSFIKWLVTSSPNWVDYDPSVWRENLVIIGGLMVIMGIVFCLL